MYVHFWRCVMLPLEGVTNKAVHLQWRHLQSTVSLLTHLQYLASPHCNAASDRQPSPCHISHERNNNHLHDRKRSMAIPIVKSSLLLTHS